MLQSASGLGLGAVVVGAIRGFSKHGAHVIDLVVVVGLGLGSELHCHIRNKGSDMLS